MKKLVIFSAIAVAIGALVVSGCGYVHKSLLPGDVKSVQINIFDNESDRPDLELTVTKAIVNEVSSATDLKLTDTNPDSILKGTLVERPNRSLITSEVGVVTTGDVTLEVDLVWTDARTNGEIPLRTKKVVASATYDVLRGESRALAVQKAADLLAKRVVEAMQEEW
jgi:hypothetical protein